VLSFNLFKITIEKVQNNIAQLYEQGASIERIEQYWHKWLVWARSGLDGIDIDYIELEIGLLPDATAR